MPGRVLVNNKRMVNLKEKKGENYITLQGGVVLTQSDKYRNALSIITHPN